MIELLVVISIIAILAGLSFAGLSSAMAAVKRTQAAALISQLKTAVTAFNTEYGVWPTSDANDQIWQDKESWHRLCASLAGNKDPGTGAQDNGVMDSSGNNPKNSRSITFFDFNRKDLDSPATAGSAVKDPTGPKANALYFRIIMDADYDGKVSVMDADTTDLTANQDLNAGVAIWSKNGTGGTKKAHSISSW